MVTNRLDIVIFGATGYTGKYVVKDAVHMCKEQNIKFGIAGCRKEALDAVFKEFASNIEDIPIILADVKNEESLKKMTERARILINCCGPYIFYGEPVIKACIVIQTHYVDVTAEEEFMEEMQLKYNEATKKAGIYIVSACGFDCIPSDMGVIFTQQNFEGEVNGVETYLNVWPITIFRGPIMNYTSWESVVYIIAHANKLQELQRKLYPTKLSELTPKLRSRGIAHRTDVSKGWSLPFPIADRSVIFRTQRFLYDKYKQRPAQVEIYITLKYFYQFLALLIFGPILILMTRTSCGRNLLLKHPSLFSASFISQKNPNPQILKTNFSVTFKTSGWTEKLANPIDKHTSLPNKEVVTRITSDLPGYEANSIMTMLSAITILNEIDKMPDNGGVLTPGAAFSKTSLIEQLNKYNINFEVISSVEK